MFTHFQGLQVDVELSETGNPKEHNPCLGFPMLGNAHMLDPVSPIATPSWVITKDSIFHF